MFRPRINNNSQRAIFENMYGALSDGERMTVINFGGELYREGLIDGVIFTIGSVVLGWTTKKLVDRYIDYRVNKEMPNTNKEP